MMQPCRECPWVTCGFLNPNDARRFITKAMSGEHHRCHMIPDTMVECRGSREFADGRGFAAMRLIEAAYKKRRNLQRV